MERKFQLYPAQHAFVQDLARFTGFFGGVGSGKTVAGAIKALVTMIAHPDWKRGVITAPTYRMLEDQTLRTCIDVWGDLVLKVNRSSMIVALKTGQSVLFRSTENPDSLRGPNLSWAWMDEAAYSPLRAFEVLIARLRARGILGPLWMTSTPNGLNWVYDRVNDKSIRAHYAASDKNIFVHADYADSLRENYPDELAAQEVGGQFIRIGAGIIKPEYFQPITRDALPFGLRWVRAWDLATSTKSSADYTASTRIAELGGRFFVDRPIRVKAEWPDVEQLIKQTARAEVGETVRVGIEAVAFQSAALQALARSDISNLVGFEAVRPDADKLTRALPWIAKGKQGNLFLVEDWGNDWSGLKEEIMTFPEDSKRSKGFVAHDDIIDTISYGTAMLAGVVLTAY